MACRFGAADDKYTPRKTSSISCAFSPQRILRCSTSIVRCGEWYDLGTYETKGIKGTRLDNTDWQIVFESRPLSWKRKGGKGKVSEESLWLLFRDWPASLLSCLAAMLAVFALPECLKESPQAFHDLGVFPSALGRRDQLF